MPAWQGIDRHARAGAGIDRLREVLVPLQGLALPAGAWERDVLPRRVGAWSPAWLDTLCAGGELVWVGAGPHGRSGRVALYFREDAAAIGPPPRAGQAPEDGLHAALRTRLAAAPAFFSDLLADLDVPPQELARAVWDLVWAGEVTNDAWAPLRAGRLTLAQAADRAARRGRSRFAAGRRGAPTQVQGRWTLTAPLFTAGAEGLERRRALAELLLERYGVVTREQVLAEGIRGGFALLYDSFSALETLGLCRRGYFIEGLGGAQFALPGAVERLRATPLAPAAPLVLAAADPAQPYGAALPWPKAAPGAGRPARTDGAYVVLERAGALAYLERGGHSIVRLDAAAGDDEAFARGLRALADAVREGRIAKIALERIDGEQVLASPLRELLTELGFREGPRRMTLTA
jgi:ATP-dependent Lhr-like helicase